MSGKVTPGSWTPETRPTGKPFEPGKSANPGGKPSIARDLELATRLLNDEQKKALGVEDGEPLTAAQLRAVWWATVVPVAVAGPKSTADTSWRYAHQEVGNRLMGKPKETVEIVDPKKAPDIDWSKVPIEDRRRLLASLDEIQKLAEGQDGERDAEVPE